VCVGLLVLAGFLTWLDYSQVQQNRTGNGPFATELELKEILKSCGVEDPVIRSPALFLPYQGLAWHGYGEYGKAAIACYKVALSSRNLTAGMYQEIG
jgi:hypothetical protein